MRLVYLDSNIVIYLIEQPPGLGPRAAAHVAILNQRGDLLVVSDLTRLECRTGPLGTGDASLLTKFDAFFSSPDVLVLALTPAVCDLAAAIRARHRYKLADAINLAVAVESGCDVFLTNDLRLSTFPDITVQVLP